MSHINHLSSSKNISFRWNCPLTRTGRRSAHSTCAKEFAKELGFQLIETSDDGNCFFYTLTKFGKRSGYAPLLLEQGDHQNAMALREQLVQHIQDNIHLYRDFLFNNNNLGSVNEQIDELRENGAWASAAGDLVPIAGANAFGIHINMYNIINGGDHDYVSLIPIRSKQPSNVYVSIMRVREGHFQLLWPRSGEFQRGSPSYNVSLSAPIEFPWSRNVSLSAPIEPSDEKEVIAAAKMAVQAAHLAVQAAKKVSSAPRSVENQERKLNQMVQNLNQLSLGEPLRRSTRITRSQKTNRSFPSITRPSRASRTSHTRKKSVSPSSSRYGSYENNNNELRRAIEESLRYP